ncbi:MAG TPA: HDOD domain-containing protein [Steroidobacteraceae bacterium]|jgi:HD-like signal output (HDOD) protein
MISRLVLVIVAIVLAAGAAAAITWLVLSRTRRERSPAVRTNIAPAQASAAGSPAGSEAGQTRALTPPEVFARLHEHALGSAAPSAAGDSAHQRLLQSAIGALEDAATRERYAPRRPNMLPRLLSATNDENISRRELTSIIARDPALVGGLLKIANSSYYRVTPEPVESVDRAVALLGTDGLRSLISAVLMQPIFRIGGAQFPRFPETAWEHAFRSASAGVACAALVEQADPFAAELLSLVMGLAGIVIFRAALDQYALEPELTPDARIIAALLDAQSSGVARHIGASWELSERMLQALEAQTTAATAHPTPLGRSLQFGRIVGALAVLRINRVLDEDTATASIPATGMHASQVERMWTRLTLDPAKRRTPR